VLADRVDKLSQRYSQEGSSDAASSYQTTAATCYWRWPLLAVSIYVAIRCKLCVCLSVPSIDSSSDVRLVCRCPIDICRRRQSSAAGSVNVMIRGRKVNADLLICWIKDVITARRASKSRPEDWLTPCSIKRKTLYSRWYLCQILVDFHNSFPGWFSSKFAVKPLLKVSPLLAYIATPYLVKH